jgi:hypothetical protein
MLTDAKVKGFKPRDSAQLVLDSGGLYLRVSTTGLKSWLWRRVTAGNSEMTTLGRYPAMSLAQARLERDRLRDYGPAVEAEMVPVETLEEVAKRWHERQAPLWKPHHCADVLASLQAESFPAIGRQRL